jgi:hypothetical protein
MTTINPRRRTVPIIPETILKRHNVHEASDTRFRAAARLMQSLWRDQRGHPIGRQDDTRGQGRKLGSRLTPALAQAGANFISPAIATFARREVAYREISAVMDTKRLFGNLLSSQALTINLLGVLKLDLEVATGVFSRLFPTTVAQVEDIWFEHSPGRGDPAFTGDHTAFDALVLCRTPAGLRSFIAVEVKYTEGVSAGTSEVTEPLELLSLQEAFYRNPESEKLRSGGLQQFWREHLLAVSMVRGGLFDQGAFLVIAPTQNHQCQKMIASYGQELVEGGSPAVGFEAVATETFVDAIEQAGAREEAKALRERYLDFACVDRALFEVIDGGQSTSRRIKRAA